MSILDEVVVSYHNFHPTYELMTQASFIMGISIVFAIVLFSLRKQRLDQEQHHY